MLTREQIYTVLTLRNKNTLFSSLPVEVIQQISEYGQDPNSMVAQALHHAAFARKEDVTALLALLEANPKLLLQAGNVKTPGGDEIRRVAIYEFLLGAGDYELAEQVQAYFSKIEGGEEERLRQYERYRPHIEGMLTQKPYDLSSLVELIKKASPDEIKALLNKDMTGVREELCAAFNNFRADWAPRVLQKPCMHYNYASLQQAFKLLAREAQDLYKTSGNNYDKINLVWRQLIGFEMRRLPGIDRCIMAQSLYEVIENKAIVDRSFAFRENLNGVTDFPIIDSDDSFDGLGGDFAVDIDGVGAGRCGAGWRICLGTFVARTWRTHVEQKLQACRTYGATANSGSELVCNSLSLL